jgi:hypothetical protein
MCNHSHLNMLHKLNPLDVVSTANSLTSTNPPYTARTFKFSGMLASAVPRLMGTNVTVALQNTTAHVAVRT